MCEKDSLYIVVVFINFDPPNWALILLSMLMQSFINLTSLSSIYINLTYKVSKKWVLVRSTSNFLQLQKSLHPRLLVSMYSRISSLLNDHFIVADLKIGEGEHFFRILNDSSKAIPKRLRVSQSRKQISKFSLEPKNEWNIFVFLP